MGDRQKLSVKRTRKRGYQRKKKKKKKKKRGKQRKRGTTEEGERKRKAERTSYREKKPRGKKGNKVQKILKVWKRGGKKNRNVGLTSIKTRHFLEGQSAGNVGAKQVCKV